MGVDSYGFLVYGVPIRMKQTSHPKTVTRYHEITGKPYERLVPDYAQFIGDTDCEFDVTRFGDDEHTALVEGNKLFDTDSVGYFGIQLGQVDPKRGEVVTINETEAKLARRQFRDLALKHFEDDAETWRVIMANANLHLIGTEH